MIKRLEVYDLECLSNLFTYTGLDTKTKTYFQFVICKWRNDLSSLIKHLNNDDKSLMMIGFNNEAYDYPLLHHIIKHYEEYKYLDGQTIAQKIYEKSQEIISMEFSAIADKNKYILQLDLYRIWHYNNKARRASLKDLEVAMNLPNVEEMPIHHTHWCKQGDEICILSYNKNDVYSTYMFFLVTLGKTDYSIYKGKNKIALRQAIQKQFHVNVLNMGDVPMGYALILNLYSRATHIPIYDLKQLKTYRKEIQLKDCIPTWANVKSKEFNKFVDLLKNTTIKGNKGELNFTVNFHNYNFDFGLGGSHGCIKSGVYSSDDYWVILDYDVGF